MIEALFVGGQMNGRVEALARPFPTHSFRMYQPNARKNSQRFLIPTRKSKLGIHVVDAHCVEHTYILDLKHFEPYVYVLKGLSVADAERQHRKAYRDAYESPPALDLGRAW